MKRTFISAAVLASLAFAGAAPVAMAQDWTSSFSPNQARDEVEQGKIVPLRTIYRNIKREYGGYQVDTNLFSRDNGGKVYNIDWITENGRKMTFVVDAQTGRIIRKSGG